jgi:hypothetical protein
LNMFSHIVVRQDLLARRGLVIALSLGRWMNGPNGEEYDCAADRICPCGRTPIKHGRLTGQAREMVAWTLGEARSNLPASRCWRCVVWAPPPGEPPQSSHDQPRGVVFVRPAILTVQCRKGDEGKRTAPQISTGSNIVALHASPVDFDFERLCPLLSTDLAWLSSSSRKVP